MIDPDWIDFEHMIVTIDGEELPITRMIGRGRTVTDPDDCEIVFAGKNNTWVSARVIRAPIN